VDDLIVTRATCGWAIWGIMYMPSTQLT
jgi:hypothetical protein